MSWDISVFASNNLPPPVADMPEDWRGLKLGSLEYIRAAVSACFPKTDWNDPTWGSLEETGYSFEFNTGDTDPCDGFMIHVRGGGDAVSELIVFAKKTGWYLLDCSQGEWLHHCENPESGWRGFQEYRDHVIKTTNKPKN